MDSTFSVRRSRLIRAGIAAGIVAVTLFAAACGPSDTGAAKLKAVPKGARRADIIAAMGTGPFTVTRPQDSARVVSGFRSQRFISDSKVWEVLWYRDEPGSLTDAITKATDTPVVIESDTLVGWGWKFYGPFAGQHNLPDPSTDGTRRDSISKSQLKTN